MKAHFVTFLSPGTFVHEASELPIDSWDTKKAQKMAHGIMERHGATPFGFYFTTRERKDSELDSRVIQKGPTYYLGGQLFTVEQLEAQNDTKNETLIWNMRANKWKQVVINTNSFKIAQPIEKGDVVLNWKPKAKK